MKKASLQLSINAIVVLILAITMLGLGLGFMRNLFSSGEKQFERASDAVEKEVLEQMKESGKDIEFNRPVIKVKAGEKEQVWLGFRNQGDAPIEYLIKSNEKSSIGANACNNLRIGSYNSVITIPPKEVFVSPVTIEPGAGMDKGTCVVQMEICTPWTNNNGAQTCNIVESTEYNQVHLTVEVI